MKLLHWLVQHPIGRIVSGVALKTRILPGGWNPVPESPVELVGRIAPVPLLVVHGDADKYFPVAHAEALYAAAGEPRELWIERGFGHAEAAAAREQAGREVVDRIGRWVRALPAGGRADDDAEAVADSGEVGEAEEFGEVGEAEEFGEVGEVGEVVELREAGGAPDITGNGAAGRLGGVGEILEDEAG